jgi:hypothetical protein
MLTAVLNGRLQRNGLPTIGNRAFLLCGLFLALFCVRANCAISPSLSSAEHNSSGIAWAVKGAWHVEGTREPVFTGDSIEPRSLLEPGVRDSAHSITILLPDGQQILYECFTAKDCARGFRVPALYHAPDPFVTDMLGRIRAVLVRQRDQTAAKPAKQLHIARDEAAAVLDPGNRIEIAGLAAKLSDGKYSGDLRSVNQRYPERSGILLEKSGRSIALTVPGPGLYLLTIFDSMKWPRIEFTIAVPAAQDSSVIRDFQKEHALLANWIKNYFGWPIHDFQRAYLKSLMLGIPPAPGSNRQMASVVPSPPGVTAEPAFNPPPGFFTGNIAVTLQCTTPGAVIHYSIDTSQPLESSPAYHAPIIVKGMPITIKAFAASPGKKDSAVVTGNFRINAN